MSSLVSDFIINPVARTVRRLSSPFATATEPEPVRPFSHNFAVVQNSAAIDECDGIPIPIAALRRFTRSPDIALGARSPPLMIPQQRASTAPVEFDPSRPSTAPSLTPLRPEMERHGVSDIIPTVAVERAVPEPHDAIEEDAQLAHKRSRRLPADDGMTQMRRRILSIQSSNITYDQKRYLMQQLLTENYATAKRAKTVAEGKVEAPQPRPGTFGNPESPSGSTSRDYGFGVSALETIKSWTGLEDKATINVSEEDRLPTYVPAIATIAGDEGGILDDDDDTAEGAGLVLGCMHYRRNVKLHCVSCEKWYTCRLCHDAAEEHTLPRRLTKYMLCMLCGHPQKASDTCDNCGESAAQYYCNICKLWSDDVNKPIYHCDDCGICRVGHGLDKDFFHCKTCRACISITQIQDHKCIERATDADCPICGEHMFASPKTVIFMDCGHSIHRTCFNEYMASSYKCPICSKSIVNMEALFTNLANLIQEQPMPEEFRNVRSVVLCNDCSAKCSTPYHFLGLRCQICKSFNTAELDRSQMPGEGSMTPGQGNGATATPTTLACPESPLHNRSGASDHSALHSPSLHPHSPYHISQDPASPTGTHPYAEPELDFAMDEEEELGFWGGEPRSGPESDDDDEDDLEEDSDAESSENDDEDDDEEEDEDDEDIILLGHR